MQPTQDIMATRALQQMRDTVTQQPAPIMIPARQASVAATQPDTAPQPQPKEEKPAAAEEPTQPQETNDKTDVPDSPAATDPANTPAQIAPEQTAPEQTEPGKQRRQNRQARRNKQQVPSAEEPTIAPASATEQTSVPIPSQQTTGATQAAQAASPTGAENPWMEAALQKLAANQMYRLFGRKKEPETVHPQTPTENDPTPTTGAVPAVGTNTGTNNPWVETALRRSIPQTAPERTPEQPDEETTPATPVSNTGSTTQSTGEARTVREAKSGYGDAKPHIDRLEAEKQDASALLNQAEQGDAEVAQAIDAYAKSSHNPLHDIVMEKQKPEPDEKKKKRLKTAAILIALNDIFAAIGQGIGGFSVKPTDPAPLTYLRNQLQQLDDIYRNDKRRYDQNELLEAVRRGKVTEEAAKTKVELEKDRQKWRRERHEKALEGNRDLTKKQAELGLEASKFDSEMGYKYDKMKSDEKTADKNRAVQWAKLAKEHPEVSVLNYKTGKAELLDKEKWARLGGYIARILDRRESAKKGPYGEWIAGKSPLPLNSRITDEELKELQKAATNGEKLTANQLGVITRLFNEMENGEVYETENSTPFYMPDKPRSMYAQSIRPQYENWLQGMREYYTLTGQMPDNTITVDEARKLFDGMQNVPDKEITDVLQAAGWQVTE